MKKSQHRAKERILTQSHPARVGHGGAGAVVLKARGLFLVTNTAGEVPFERPHAFGLYLHDCRFPGVYTLRINGATPTALAVASVWLEWVELRGLRLGQARLTLRIERHGEIEARVAAVDVHEGTMKVESDDDTT